MNDADNEDTLRMLAQSAESFARPDSRRTRAARDANQGFDRSVWNEIARMGWLAVMISEAQGGLGLGARAAILIAQRFGYAGYLEPYVGVAVMALGCLAACSKDDEHAHWIGGVLDGRQLLGLAWQPGDGRLEPDATEVIAREQSGVTRLSGLCRFITVPQADAFIVAAHQGEDLALYRVERDAAGVRMKLETAADGTALGQLTLTDVKLHKDALLARGPLARQAIEGAVEAGVIATAAELLGLIERSIELTLEYLRTRRQFGQAIGAFQALQHRAVDMWIQKELTRAALRSALQVVDDPAAGDDARRAAASSVKARASQAALQVCGQAVQLHGAIGFTDEYELGIYVNRALTLAARLGNAAMHRRRYGALTPVVERCS